MEKLTNIIEALLFVSGKEISIQDLADKLEVTPNEINLAVMELQTKYAGDCGLRIIKFNEKVQFASNPDYAEMITKVLSTIRERDLSNSMLETAAIIAFKQPVTRAEIEHIRGNSDYAVRILLSLDLITIVGKKDTVGHPSLFAITDKFLKHFGISSIEELPNYDELKSQLTDAEDNSDKSDLFPMMDFADYEPESNEPQAQMKMTNVGVAVTQEEPDMIPAEKEEIPDFLKDDDVDYIEAEDDGDEADEDDGDEDGDEEFDEYSIDDAFDGDEAEEEDDSEYEDDEEVDDGYEEDDK